MSASPPATTRGLLDTSVVIDLDRVPADALPQEPSISAVTLAELTAGPHATGHPHERARRQERVQRIEATTEPYPFDERAARAYGRVYAATLAADRKPRGARIVDLFIAAVAIANELPLYTRNPADFAHLTTLGLDVRAVELPREESVATAPSCRPRRR